MKKAVIFNIQKFSVNDGPGIRTTVFMKGCPLDCLWCHNPESKSKYPQLLCLANKCIGCGVCENACPQNCHKILDGAHTFDRKLCTDCGKCADECPAGALSVAGEEKSADEIVARVMKDKVFYETSGGGVTLSGGEPMFQPEATLMLLKAFKNEGLHICMETCGFAKEEHLKAAAEFVDIFLFDYKLTDPDKHKKYTGADNHLILKNLEMLDGMGKEIILRCPIIPGINDDDSHFDGIAKVASGLKNIIGIDVEPYHPLGSGKAESLGKDYPLADLGIPGEETVNSWIAKISAKTSVPVRKA